MVTSRAIPLRVAAGDKFAGPFAENNGTKTLSFLEMFGSDHYAHVAPNQWMAFTPVELIKQHLNLYDATIAKLRKQKVYVVV